MAERGDLLIMQQAIVCLFRREAVKILKIGLVVSLLLAAQSVMAAEWLKMFVSTEKDKEIRYVDIDSIRSEYNYITAWVRMDYPTVQKLHNNKMYRQVKQKWQIQCNNNKFAVTQVYYYTSKGDVVDSYTTYANWQDAIPDTVGDGIVKEVCWAKDQDRTILGELIKMQNQPNPVNN